VVTEKTLNDFRRNAQLVPEKRLRLFQKRGSSCSRKEVQAVPEETLRLL